MNRRLQVLWHWCRGGWRRVSAVEMGRFLTHPPVSRRAPQVILRTEVVESDLRVTLRNIRSPLYWPKEFDLAPLHQVLSEAFFPDNWHFYEVPPVVVRPGDVVVDCGAAEGMFSLQAVDRAAHVYVIEPLPRFVETLRRTFADAPSVTILPVAVSENPGAATVAGNSIMSVVREAREGVPIRVETIDGLFWAKDRRVDYLKADLEGADLAMLRGAVKTISRWKPRIAITAYHHPKHDQEMRALLRRACPEYAFRSRGIYQETGSPVLLHAWVPDGGSR